MLVGRAKMFAKKDEKKVTYKVFFLNPESLIMSLGTKKHTKIAFQCPFNSVFESELYSFSSYLHDKHYIFS